MKKIAIDIVAPSSPLSKDVLKKGITRIAKEGALVSVDSQCYLSSGFYAGPDMLRVEAFLRAAYNPISSVVWSARGGYGAQRLLPYLDLFSTVNGCPPKKMFVGYSDSSAFYGFLKKKWKWSILHAPMPGREDFLKMSSKNFHQMMEFVHGEIAKNVCFEKIKFLGKLKFQEEQNFQIFGGNLSVLVSLIGTPYWSFPRGGVLFLEEVAENFTKIDRMVQQLDQAKVFSKCAGIVLGGLYSCEDRLPSGAQRKKISHLKALELIFGEIGKKWKIPIAYGLSVGHQPKALALPMFARWKYQTLNKKLVLDHWSWFGASSKRAKIIDIT